MLKLFKKEQEFDLIGIGDMVVDTFIELIDAWIETDNPQQSRELCMRFGDKIPYKKEVSVYGTGNSINACHSANRLGLKTAIISDTGSDVLANQCLMNLSKKSINTDLITSHKNNNTNHNFILRYKEDRTILVHHNEYQYKFPNQKIKTKWVYLSSLANNSLGYHGEIVSFLKLNPEIKLAFQPGTFQIKIGSEKLAELYKMSEIFFCNKEEAEKILNINETNLDYREHMKKLLLDINNLGPKIAVITDGPKGAFVYDSYTQKYWHMPIYPDIAPPVDRTGAGDAFASTFTSAMILGENIETALKWAPINSMNVVQYVGAQAGHLTAQEIEDFLKTAPENYQPKNF
jgi:ribokinase